MTTGNNLGPPEKRRAGASPGAEPHHQRPAGTTHTDQAQGIAAPRQCAADTVPVAWRRRRQTSYRLVPLDCGCRDPWPCRCTQPPLTDKALDGWRDAANHVLDCGQIALVPLEVRRALWSRQGSDRLLAELRDLARIGQYKTGVHRIAFSPADIEARKWLPSPSPSR